MERRVGLGLAIGLIAAGGLLASCHRPASSADTAAQPAAATTAAAPAAGAAISAPVGTERAGPAKWNAATNGFELNGKPVTTAKIWTFDGSTDGFTAMSSLVSPAAGQGLGVKVMTDPIIRSPKGLNVPGAKYNLVLVRLTRVAPGALWDGALYYATSAHGESAGFFGKPIAGDDPKVGETTTLVYDMAHQRRGGPDWTQSTIDAIRLDIEDKAGGVFVIRQIAIGADPDPDALASMAPPPKAKPADAAATANH